MAGKNTMQKEKRSEIYHNLCFIGAVRGRPHRAQTCLPEYKLN